MLELVSNLADTLQCYESKQARDLLQSETWAHIRKGIKYLVSELEIKGKSLAAARVDREYTQLAEALRKAVTKDNPPAIKDDFVLWDISQEFLCTLSELCHFQAEIDRQPNLGYKTDNSQPGMQFDSCTITEILNKAIIQLAEQPNIRIKKSKLPHSVRRPGPERVSLSQAKHRIKLLQDWADVQDRNKDLPMQSVSLEQFAKSVSRTATQIKAHQSWYRKYRNHGDLPDDPRKVDPRKLAELFE